MEYFLDERLRYKPDLIVEVKGLAKEFLNIKGIVWDGNCEYISYTIGESQFRIFNCKLEDKNATREIVSSMITFNSKKLRLYEYFSDKIITAGIVDEKDRKIIDYSDDWASFIKNNNPKETCNQKAVIKEKIEKVKSASNKKIFELQSQIDDIERNSQREIDRYSIELSNIEYSN